MQAAGRKKLAPGDFILILLTLGLVIFGVIMVFSASYYWSIDKTGSPYHFLIRDVFWAVSGFAIMLFATVFDYHRYSKYAPWLLGISILLLLLVLTPLGREVNGATRWIGVGPITLMPGEIAKPSAILFTAWFLSVKPGRIMSFTHGILPLLLIALGFAALIMMQPNMSTAMTVVFIIVAMMFVAGLSYKYLVAAMVLGGVGIFGLIFSDPDGYRLKRFTSFTDPFADALGDGYQVVQSLLALGSGGILGLGLGKSVQKNLYLPEPQNDFILAIIGEELGYVGMILLMLAYMLLVWRGIKVAMDAPDRFGMLLASGITAMIAIQVMLNIAVVTSSMPATGVTLPFISYGGNALWIFMFSMGVLLNISRHRRRTDIPKEEIRTR